MQRSPLLIGTAVLVAASLSACASPANGGATDDAIRIVASTNVYGDIAEAVGGDLVSVTSLISSSAQDPHSYEASAQDQLAISKAQLVIENGGGYDPFVDTLVEASGTKATVLTATDLTDHADAAHDDEGAEEEADHDEAEHEDGDDHGHIEGFNEHVWYDFDVMDDTAHEIAHLLADLDSANAATFESNYETFSAKLDGLEAEADSLETRLDGQGVAVTEPVPLYLLEAVGLENRTPEAFTEAIEEGGDVPPVALQETLALFDSGSVVMLAYNEQTASPETERVREAAEAAGIPVVSFTETLPDGEDYVSWMTSNLAAISAALPE